MHIRFDYVNAKGERSTRSVKDIDIQGPYHIIGFCELKNEDRTFNIMQMSNIHDLEKNVPIEDMQAFLGMLNKHGSLKKKYENYEPPLPVELHCKKCGAFHEIEIRWAKKHDSFVCDCGQGYNITVKQK
jgi:predicted DNA-binding transcriptional regulator YafY